MIVPQEWLAEAGPSAPKLETILLVQADIDRHPEWLGSYLPGKDTRGFVLATEANCEAWNCWMRRDGNGNPAFVSQPLTNQQLATIPLPALPV